MKPAPFAYHAPTTLAEALSMLDNLGEEARVLAGGQSLLPLMNFRLAQPQHLVDINTVPELDYIRAENGTLIVGAGARQSTLERSPEAMSRAPLLVEATTLVAHPPIRHRGTVCGSVAHADPAAELPAALLVQGGVAVVASTAGERLVRFPELFRGPFSTDLRPGELLKEVRADVWPAGSGYAFVEVARRHGDFAIAGAAVLLHLESGTVRRAAIGLCGVGPTPIRAAAAERSLEGGAMTESDVQAAVGEAVRGLSPATDVHGDAAYRVQVTRVCVRRALEQALRRARGEAR